MKILIKTVSLLVLVASFACSNNTNDQSSTVDPSTLTNLDGLLITGVSHSANVEILLSLIHI